MDIFEEIVALKKAGAPAVLATVIEALGSAPGKPCARMRSSSPSGRMMPIEKTPPSIFVNAILSPRGDHTGVA